MSVVIKTLLVVLLVIIAVYGDLKTRKIPNRLTVPFALVGLGVNIAFDFPGGLLTGLLGFVVGFLVFLIPYMMKAMGAGDIKLMAALGAITDWQTVVYITLFTALTGGIVIIITKARSGGLIRTFKRMGQLIAFYFFSLVYKLNPVPTMENRKEKYRIDMTDEENDYIPYAVAIALGSLVTIILSRVGILSGLSI